MEKSTGSLAYLDSINKMNDIKIDHVLLFTAFFFEDQADCSYIWPTKAYLDNIQLK